jgi:hypothetical protein
MGPDGKIISEKYYDNNLGQNRNGNTVNYKYNLDLRKTTGIQELNRC